MFFDSSSLVSGCHPEQDGHEGVSEEKEQDLGVVPEEGQEHGREGDA